MSAPEVGFKRKIRCDCPQRVHDLHRYDCKWSRTVKCAQCGVADVAAAQLRHICPELIESADAYRVELGELRAADA